mgnify:FL=1|tara:strand:- start:656 stop:1942 length:1287 start_codon:yes stop_codon:yes gene_type:complete
MTEKTVTEYPTGLSSIPYASFLQIERFSYESAQKYAAQNFNDALGSLGRSAIARKVDGAVDGLATAYGSGSGDLSKNGVNLYTTQYTTVAKKNRRGRTVSGGETVDIATADDSTEVELKNGEITTIGKLKQRKNELRERQNKGLMASKCMLPLPNEFQYKYGADWNNEFKLGTLALAADEAFRFAGIAGLGGGVGALVQGGVNNLTGAKDVSGKQADKATKMVQSVVGGMKKAADPFKIGSELSPKNVAGLAGLAPNENSIQFFERMQGREFGFRFELASRNKTESNTVIEIIEWFKRGMHPGSKNGKGSAVLLTFPDVFVLTPKFVACNENGESLGDPIQHPMMPRTKLCALTGLTINTTPFGQMQTIFDGSIPIVTMELTFKETTKLTRVDMEGASFKKKGRNPLQTNSGVFRRDSNKDNISEVSF